MSGSVELDIYYHAIIPFMFYPAWPSDVLANGRTRIVSNILMQKPNRATICMRTSKQWSSLLPQGNFRGVDIVDIVPVPLYTRNRRAEQPIPHPGLFAVIMAVLPALTMMKIVVLDNELHIAQP